jgi:hypothetical protein
MAWCQIAYRVGVEGVWRRHINYLMLIKATARRERRKALRQLGIEELAALHERPEWFSRTAYRHSRQAYDAKLPSSPSVSSVYS